MNYRLSEPKSAQKQEELSKSKVMPFDQVSLEKQLDVLKGCVAFHSKEGKPAGYLDIAPLAGISGPMVSGCFKFWASIGVLVQSGRKYLPSDRLIDFCNKLSWGAPDDAWRVLGEAIVDSWFVRQTEMIFSVRQNASEEDLQRSLASAIGVQKTPATESSLKRLIELLEKCRFVARQEDGSFTWVSRAVPNLSIELAEEKGDLVTFVIASDKFVVPRQTLKDFVVEKGKKLPPEEHDLGDRN